MSSRANQRKSKQAEQVVASGAGAPIDDVKTTEERLTKLLGDFNSGKVQAFGLHCPYEKLDEVRRMQEDLVKLHFEIDNKLQSDSNSRSKRKPKAGLLTEDGRREAQSNILKLSSELEALGYSIQYLHHSNRPQS
ncbi:hypothetical protein Ciccas_014222 [Cichlidogyrus casuarinus]|uniref:Coiled-coil domain containing 28B n=1 Tax=Cichlidogyrus casuarinus TaxID=1844966 RepID=A0ABD2PIQ2_9PLAT